MRQTHHQGSISRRLRTTWRHHKHTRNPIVIQTPVWLGVLPFDIATRWRDDWESVLVANHSLVGDRAIQQPGFNLPRHQWCLLNRLRTIHDLCDCRTIQTQYRIVEAYLRTKFEGGTSGADEAADD